MLDVRTPAEFEHAQIPGAINLPLFSDEERVHVGRTYKQVSRQDAIKIGMDYFGPKMKAMVEKLEELLANKSNLQLPINASEHMVLVHCWRGGMRSGAVAWLLGLYGFKVYVLEGGYKRFRTEVLQLLEKPYQIRLLGGYTGSGKTDILAVLEKQGENIIDLENLASHKGSSFGSIGMPKQTSQEMFENKLAMALRTVLANNTNPSIWVEDESQRLGHLYIPSKFWESMTRSKIYFLDIGFEERLDNIVEDYGKLDAENLIEAIKRIEKRLGGLETKNATALLESGQVKDSFAILLKYYDRWYLKGLEKKEKLDSDLMKISCKHVEAVQNAKILLSVASSGS